MYDENLIPHIAAFLKAKPKAFVVMHTIGSHWAYNNHYPDSLRRFVPVCEATLPDLCTTETVVNSYDNTILNTDHVLSSVIHLVEPRDALVLYVSDHGESLGDPDYLHGHGSGLWKGPASEMDIPLIVWASPTFAQRHPKRVEALRSRGKSPTTYQAVFHSLIDCAGIGVSALDPHWSVCRTN